MTQINQLILEGIVNKEVEVEKTYSGSYVATITVETKRLYKNSNGGLTEEVSYFDVEAYGEQFAYMCKDKAKNGTSIRVVGRLKQNRWTDIHGKKQSKIYVIAEHIDFLEKSNV